MRPDTLNAGEDPNTKAFGVRFNAASPLIWLLAVPLVIGGFAVTRLTWRWVEKAWDEALIAAREKGFYA
jgi:branched-chain amino acid transport system permease protein